MLVESTQEVKVYTCNKNMDKLKINGYSIDWRDNRSKHALSRFINKVNTGEVFGEIRDAERTKRDVGYIEYPNVAIRITQATLTTSNVLVLSYYPIGPKAGMIDENTKLSFRLLTRLINNKIVIEKIITLDVVGV